MARKNGFWNLCFSLIPGAGQMYQGFLKRGVSIMALFFGWLMLCAFFAVEECMVFAPVIWFFGFFDSLHRNSLTEVERAELKDGFIFIHDDDVENLNLKKFRIPVAILLIFLGSYSLLQLAVGWMVDAGFLHWGSGIVGLVYDRLPKMVFSFAILFLGMHLIMGRKMEIMDREWQQDEESAPWMAQYHEEEPDKANKNEEGQEETKEEAIEEAIEEEQEEGEGRA